MSKIKQKQLTEEQQVELEREHALINFVGALNTVAQLITPSDEVEEEVLAQLLGFFNALKIATEVNMSEEYYEEDNN